MKFLIFFAILFTILLYGGVPNLIPVQGVLSNAEGKAIEGNIALTVTLFNAQTDGDEIWTESRIDFPVSNGYISLYLGEKTALEPLIIASAEQLWLEIVFNGERMPRVRLGSVPYALEAIKAQQIGNLTAARLEKMAITSCSSGFYFQGWQENGEPICVEDQVGTTGGSSSYTAGIGILIEDDIISLEMPYSAGEGIKLDGGKIKVDTAVVAYASHDHGDLYYSRIANAGADQLVKLTARNQNGATIYDLKETGLKEANGELMAESIKSNGNIIATGKLTASEITTAGKLTGGSIKSNGDIDASGKKITANTMVIGTTTITGLISITSDSIDIGPTLWGDKRIPKFINRDKSVTDNVVSAPENEKTLNDKNAFCTIGRNWMGDFNNNGESSSCEVKINNDGNWQLIADASYGRSICAANCLIWK